MPKILALEAEGKSIIRMQIGQPDFPTPQNIIDAAHKAMLDGYTGYAPTCGYPEARKTIAEYASKYKNIDAKPEEVVIMPGGKPVMFLTALMVVEPGDEVIYPNPSYPIYESCIKFAEGVPVPYKMSAENDFRIDLDEFKGLITPKTKLVWLNSPGNPTGGVLTPADIDAIADILRDYPDILIMSDEIYDRIVFDGVAKSIASIPGFKDRTIILDGFSKTYSMTGWRLGYGIMHKDMAQHMDMLMVNAASCTTSFSQIAAIEALTGPQDAVDRMCAAFRERRDWLVKALNDIDGVSCTMPQGAFYVFPDISSFGLSSQDFADRLLNEGGVAAVAGTGFGEFGEGYMRLSYATSLENIKEAVSRIEKFTKTL